MQLLPIEFTSMIPQQPRFPVPGGIIHRSRIDINNSKTRNIRAGLFNCTKIQNVWILKQKHANENFFVVGVTYEGCEDVTCVLSKHALYFVALMQQLQSVFNLTVDEDLELGGFLQFF